MHISTHNYNFDNLKQIIRKLHIVINEKESQHDA